MKFRWILMRGLVILHMVMTNQAILMTRAPKEIRSTIKQKGQGLNRVEENRVMVQQKRDQVPWLIMKSLMLMCLLLNTMSNLVIHL
jgi:hypothetical protein